MTARDIFLSNLAAERSLGLTATGVSFHPNRTMDAEQIFAALNEVTAAVAFGTRHSGWLGNEAS